MSPERDETGAGFDGHAVLGLTLGADRLLKTPGEILGPLGPGARIALVTNDGSRVGLQPFGQQGTKPTHIALLQVGVPLVRLFTPEHGFSASAPDGVAVPNGTDKRTGLPVTSLYGTRVRPDVETLENLDLILVDLQDIGVRFYTYLWTLSHLMEACAQAGVPVWIRDRPNPLGGREEWVEGPIPEGESPSTFLGRWPIPIRHCMTLGEMALLLTLWPNRFLWTPYPTAVNPSGERHLLRLLARSDMVETIERTPESVDDHTIQLWTRAPGWWSRAAPHLLYD